MNRVAVVGFGFMGITHTLNILRIPGLKLKAIVDVNPALIEQNLKSSTGNFKTGVIDPSELEGISKYSSLEECLRSEELDAVNICTHVNLHYEMTRLALQHGKHVFLEKPFCIDPAQARELIDLASKMNRILMVGHVVRFMPPYEQLKKWIDGGEYGRLKFLSLSRFCGLPSWGQWKDKNVKDLSGGALFDLVIHDIDFASYAVGIPGEIKSNVLAGDYTSHDYVSAMWKYPESGIHVKVEGGFTFHSNFPFQAAYMARFENASVLYTTLKGDVIRVADSDRLKEVQIPAGDGYFNEIEYFAGCIEGGKVPEKCTPESSLEAINLCYKHINQNKNE